MTNHLKFIGACKIRKVQNMYEALFSVYNNRLKLGFISFVNWINGASNAKQDFFNPLNSKSMLPLWFAL